MVICLPNKLYLIYFPLIINRSSNMATKTLDQRIVKTPGICGGKPRIDGHRITIQNITIWHDRLGWTADEIASSYDIDLADIYAALDYYFVIHEQVERYYEI